MFPCHWKWWSWLESLIFEVKGTFVCLFSCFEIFRRLLLVERGLNLECWFSRSRARLYACSLHLDLNLHSFLLEEKVFSLEGLSLREIAWFERVLVGEPLVETWWSWDEALGGDLVKWGRRGLFVEKPSFFSLGQTLILTFFWVSIWALIWLGLTWEQMLICELTSTY